MPGGAANVFGQHPLPGAKVVSVGCIGSDREGELLTSIMGSKGMDVSGLGSIPRSPRRSKPASSPTASRSCARDHEGTHKVSPDAHQRIFDTIRARLCGCDAVIIEDYDKGVVDQRLVDFLLPLARKHKKPVNRRSQEGPHARLPRHHDDDAQPAGGAFAAKIDSATPRFRSTIWAGKS
jgi:bifunctional ADP-heptose synthase (sugar kinase/adenylyltransferase)